MSARYKHILAVIRRLFAQATLGVLLVCLSAVASAQSVRGPLWSYAEESELWSSAPAYSVDPQPITLSQASIAQLKVGDILRAPAASDNAQNVQAIQITQADILVNGDATYIGRLLDGRDSGPFVLTVNQNSVFAYIEIGAQVWQLEARNSSASGAYIGWLYQSTALTAPTLSRDFHIPERKALGPSMPVLAPTTMPLTVGNALSSPNSQAARNAGINTGNFSISQASANGSVIAGASAEIRVELQNTSQEHHQALTLNLYFILDNSTLMSAPSACQQGQLSGQKVIQCALGDFAPGEKKSISYTVQSNASSKPRLISTALVGDVRHDAVINVVEDVTIDSDGDGISDFNEKLLGTNPHDSASKNSDNSVIDVLALYTPGANSVYGGQAQTRINHLIAIANQIYVDSGVHITLRPVHHAAVPYSDSTSMDTALQALTQRSGSAFAQLDALRSTYGADVVMLFRPQGAEHDRCGLANLGGFRTQGDMISSHEKDYAFSTIAIDCPVSSVVAHELGHNMGLTHSHLEDGFGGTFDFATGYGVDGRFSTVMAYPGAFNTTVRLPRFSSPLLECLGLPCGLAASSSSQPADAARALNVTRHQVAQYFPTRVPYLPNRPLATLSGENTNARIAVAASVDKGLSYTSSVRPGDKIDVNLSLFVDNRHIGLQGEVFVIATLDGRHYIQLDEHGHLSEWDGHFTGLKPYRDGSTLAPVEYLQVVNAASLGEEYINSRLQIFIAYSVRNSGDVIYTAEPLILDVTR